MSRRRDPKLFKPALSVADSGYGKVADPCTCCFCDKTVPRVHAWVRTRDVNMTFCTKCKTNFEDSIVAERGLATANRATAKKAKHVNQGGLGI